jgi:Tol biopolymer transport system component
MMAGIYLLGRRVERSHTSSAGFRQLTFRNAGISSARFTPDGQTVVYSAQSEGKPPELFTTRLDSAETRSLDLTRAEILSISSSGKMALLLAAGLGLPFRAPHSDLPGLAPNRLRGMLAEAPLAGGAPRELLEETYSADWSPDGKSLAVVRFVDGKNRLEFPAGRVLFESEIIVPRISISPSGDQVAFAIRRNLYVTEPGGRVRDLHERALEVAWCRTTNEIWFNSIESGTTNLFAIVPGRQKRRVTTLPGDFVLHDISADGRVLLARTSESSEIFGDFPGESRPRNLSHLDRSMAVDLAPSGGDLLFNEVGQSDRRGTYLGRTDGSPPKRLADCFGWALSPDGKFVLGSPRPDPQILLIPTGAGQPKLVDTPGLRPGGRMGFFPDGRRIWFMAEDAQHKRRVWVQDLSGGKPLAATPPGVGGITLSGDGRFFCAARAVDGDWYLFSTEATETHKVVGLLPGEEPTQWTADGKLLYVRTADELRPGESAVIARVYRLDPRTGRRELWKEIPPANTSGAEAIGAIFFSADGKTCVYTRHRYTSELFLVEGLK